MNHKRIYFLAFRPNLLHEAEIHTRLNAWLYGGLIQKAKPLFIQLSDLFECTEDDVFDLGKEIQSFTNETNAFSLQLNSVMTNVLSEDIHIALKENNIVSELHKQIAYILKDNPHITRTPQFSYTPQFHMNVVSKIELLTNFTRVHEEIMKNFQPFEYLQDTISLMEFNGHSWSEKFFFALRNNNDYSKVASRPLSI
ncbi:MAG: hypothetical protein FJX90_06700 [Bacteroidetes bacterium]|nr:hypothetical protein [Bacteroidota bacterium]